ncbi:MAG: PAS domain-containing sensor histidine kinase [Myxococcales bacterium]|nr:MAG: PAS domain-containing sensor histidine kinase [Myxococcales bacterium]
MTTSTSNASNPAHELAELRARVRELEEQATASAHLGARYQLLLNHLNVGVFVSSIEGRMLECNDRTLQMSGAPNREALLAIDLASMYERPEDRARLLAKLEADGEVRGFESWTRSPDGRRQCSSMNAVLAPLGRGGAPLILGMLEDITDRKLAEEQIGEGEARFRMFAEQSLLGIAILQDDAIRYVNQAIADTNGYSLEEMSEWRVSDLSRVIHAEDYAFAAEQARRKQAGDPGALTHYEYRIITKSGQTRWVEQYSRTIEYGGRPADFVTLIDITTRKQAEGRLGQLSAGMERAAKLESLGVLAAGIAHDFNNLLGVLSGHLDLARSSADCGRAARSHLDLGEQAFARARALTGQLLAFAKGGTPLRKVGSVAATVRRCAELTLSGSNVGWVLEAPPDLWSAEFDATLLSQAFNNLLINAKQAMPKGGAVRVVARNVELASPPEPGLPPGKYVSLRFVDEGPGVPPDIAERIFEPFFTTRPEGSGVGLTAAYAIMKKHQGHLEVELGVEPGAAFQVLLPAAPETKPDVAPARRAPKQGQGMVLVMDDDDMVRRVTASMLAHLGYEPIPTSHGTEALQRTRRLLAEGKVLTAALLDLTVGPGEGGRDVVGPLRELSPTLPIVASSGYSDDPIMAEPCRFGFSASLRKPFLLADLAAVLSRSIESAKA